MTLSNIAFPVDIFLNFPYILKTFSLKVNSLVFANRCRFLNLNESFLKHPPKVHPKIKLLELNAEVLKIVLGEVTMSVSLLPKLSDPCDLSDFELDDIRCQQNVHISKASFPLYVFLTL